MRRPTAATALFLLTPAGLIAQTPRVPLPEDPLSRMLMDTSRTPGCVSFSDDKSQDDDLHLACNMPSADVATLTDLAQKRAAIPKPVTLTVAFRVPVFLFPSVHPETPEIHLAVWKGDAAKIEALHQTEERLKIAVRIYPSERAELKVDNKGVFGVSSAAVDRFSALKLDHDIETAWERVKAQHPQR